MTDEEIYNATFEESFEGWTDEEIEAFVTEVEGAALYSELRELVERMDEQARKIDERKRATDSADAHANGVSCGIRWARDELEDLIDD